MDEAIERAANAADLAFQEFLAGDMPDDCQWPFVVRAAIKAYLAGTPEVSDSASTQQLIEDYSQLRSAGCELASAAMRVIGHFDGCHRLASAVAEWARVVSEEGGRKAERGDGGE